MSQLTRTETFDNILTSTFYDVRKDLINCVYQITPFFDWLNAAGSFKAKAPDGLYFLQPIKYAKGDQNVGSFGRGDLAGTAEKEIMTNYQFYVKNVWNNVVRYFVDDRRQRGKAMILDYAQTKVEDALDALIDMFETDLFTQNSDVNSITALPTLIAEDPTSGTLGGITRSTNAAHQNQYKDCTGLTTTTSLLDEMERMYNLCSMYKGRQKSPDMLIMDRPLYQDYKRIARAMGMITKQDSPQKIDLGYGDCTYNGADMLWSPAAPAGSMYFMNSGSLEFDYDPMYWFEMTEWKPLAGNSLDRNAQILCVCNLTMNCAPKNGVLFNWTTVTS